MSAGVETAEVKSDDVTQEISSSIDALKISEAKSVTETENNQNTGNNEGPPANTIPGNVVHGVFDKPEEPASSTSKSTIPKRRTIVKERRMTLADILLECSDVRWVYRNGRDQQWKPFNGRDSLSIEYHYRLVNDIPLDETANSFLNKNLPKLREECEKLKAARRQHQPHSEGDDEKLVTVLNKMYRVNHDYTEVKSVFWDDDSKEIRRGMYFTTNNQPIDPLEYNEIQSHLEDYLKSPPPRRRVDQTPPKLEFNDNVYRWTSFHEFTVKRGNGPATPLYRYHEKASWRDAYPKVEHLVFVIHGVGHNGDPMGVVEGAKLLTEGADEAAMRNSGITFLPVHWRKFIDLDVNVSEEDTRPEIEYNRLSNFFGRPILEDVNLYNSYHYGKKIRNVVIQKLNDLYKKFKKINKDFCGSVSLFGHSLGSVISYDILTNYSKYKDKKIKGGTPNDSPIEMLKFDVEKLFLIGSPLGGFLKYRDESAHVKFLNTIKTLRIFNVFHTNDLVHRRLELFADSMYDMILPLEIPLANGVVSTNPTFLVFRTLLRPFWVGAYYLWRAKTRLSKGLQLLYRMDFQLQKNNRWREVHPIKMHSIYWQHPGFNQFLVHVLRGSRKFIILRKQLSDNERTTV